MDLKLFRFSLLHIFCILLILKKAIVEKLRQCQDMRNALSSTGDKILVQSFGGDDYYGSGTPAKYVKDWCSGIEKNKGSLKVI